MNASMTVELGGFYFHGDTSPNQSIQWPHKIHGTEGFHCVAIQCGRRSTHTFLQTMPGFHVSSCFRNKAHSSFVRYWNPIGFYYNKLDGFRRGRRWMPKLVAGGFGWHALVSQVASLERMFWYLWWASTPCQSSHSSTIHILQFGKLRRW